MLKRAFLFSALLVGLAAQALAVTIDTVPVGNPGNQSNFGSGAVAYNYRIGTTEVTNSQYAAFLNAKAASDTLGLYNSEMGTDPRGGIARSDVGGSYSYAVRDDMGNKPVNFVSWYDCVRFANWLNNGQGGGDTETGSYTLLGGGPEPTNYPNISRTAGATWVVASYNEWQKAAYYDPTLNNGSGGYWAYPTKSNSHPTWASANSNGDISNPGINVVNHFNNANWNGLEGNLTTVGSAGPLSQSYYGTSDQAGNVSEWTDSISSPFRLGFGSFQLGGNWAYPDNWLQAFNGIFSGPTLESSMVGFRLALVPEPSSFVLAVLGFIGLGAWTWKRKRS